MAVKKNAKKTGKKTPEREHAKASRASQVHAKHGLPRPTNGLGSKKNFGNVSFAQSVAGERVAGEKKSVAGGKEKIDAAEIEKKLAETGAIKFPLVTEKAVNMIEAENKIVFVVDKSADKPGIRKAIEDLYKVKVKKVNILRDMKARKRAIVTLAKEFKASDLATKLGVI